MAKHLCVISLQATFCFFGAIVPVGAQSLSAFGAPTPSNLFSQIHSVTKIEAAKIESSRVCNKSVPLVGGGELIDADEANLRQSASHYSDWEIEYHSGAGLNGSDASVRNDLGKKQYFLKRKEGVSASLIDIFTRTFLVRKLYSSGKDDEAVVEAERLIAKYNLRPVAHQVDTAEQATYLTKDALSNAVYFFSTLSKLRLSTNKLDEFRLLVKYLDMRNDLLSTISLFHSADEDEALVSRAAELGVEAANGLLGDETKQLVVAAWVLGGKEDRSAYLVIQGDRATTMKLDLDQAGAPPPPIIPPGRRVGAASEHPRRNQPKGTASNEGDGNDGGFQMIRTEYIQSATVIAAEKARDAYREFVERQLSRYSSKEMVLYDFQRDDHGGLITIANLPNATPISEAAAPVNVRTIRITIEQLEQINSAAPEAQSDLVRQLLPQSRDTALVAYTNPFSVRTTSYKEGVNSFAFQLQRNAAESRIYRDPLSSATLNNVRALSARLVGRGTDYVAYIDDGSFKMTDFNIVQDIKKILTSSGIKIVTGVPKSVSFGHNKNVIVITAHSDAQLSAFIDSLGKAGAFKDNYVVLNSCETPLTGDMADRIMQKYGAKAAFLHQGLIPASKVQDLLVNLTADIKAHSQRSLVDTLRDAVRQVGLNGIWSICEYLRGAHMGIQNG